MTPHWSLSSMGAGTKSILFATVYLVLSTIYLSHSKHSINTCEWMSEWINWVALNFYLTWHPTPSRSRPQLTSLPSTYPERFASLWPWHAPLIFQNLCSSWGLDYRAEVVKIVNFWDPTTWGLCQCCHLLVKRARTSYLPS